MVDNSKIIDSLNAPAKGTAADGSPLSGDTKAKQGELGKDAFLKILVTQLQHQDPLKPLEDREFVAQLAQFSSLEALLEIRDSVEKPVDGAASSPLQYLGYEVTVNSDTVSVEGGTGDSITVNPASSLTDVKVTLLGPSGAPREVINVGDMASGKQSIPLTNLSTQSGQFKVKVVGKASDGSDVELSPQVSGIVSGFVPPSKLLVGRREINPSDIVEVQVPKAG